MSTQETKAQLAIAGCFIIVLRPTAEVHLQSATTYQMVRTQVDRAITLDEKIRLTRAGLSGLFCANCNHGRGE